MARVMPHNLEAEMSVLGVAFISKDQGKGRCKSLGTGRRHVVRG